jgi:hypothetical protein
VDAPKGAPPLHALLLFAGHRGCGKGVAMTSLLRYYKRHGRADRIFWISPTLGSNRAFLDELGVAHADRLDSCDNAALETVIAGVEEEAAAWEEYRKKLRVWQKLHRARDVSDLEPEVLTYAHTAGLLEGTSKKPESR